MKKIILEVVIEYDASTGTVEEAKECVYSLMGFAQDNGLLTRQTNLGVEGVTVKVRGE